MRVEIHTIIVDNMPKIAESIQAIFTKRNKESVKIEYIIHVFKDDTHFKDAKSFILNCITADQTIDLMFCDYHLDGGNNGIELFNLFIGTGIRPYKILHSFTDQTLEDHLDEKDRVWDTFSKSKTSTKIKENIIKFEENILKIKLTGNPNSLEELTLRNELNESAETFLVESEDRLEKREFSFDDVVYVLPLDSTAHRFKIVYRHNNLFESFESSKSFWGAKDLNRNYKVFHTIIAKDDPLFGNNPITINLKWVSQINPLLKTIRLISFDSIIRKIQYGAFKKYNIADKGHPEQSKQITDKIISEINKNIPHYFST